MAVNIHITIIELNALHTKRQNLFQELDAVIHLLMEAKHWGLRKSRNATSLNSRFKSLDTLKVKIISVTFRRVIRTNHKKASKIWRHENIQLGGCYLRIKKSLLKCNWTIRKRLPRCKMRLKKRLLAFSRRLHARIRKTRYMHKMRCLLINRRSLLLALRLLWKTPIFPSN